MEILLPRDDMGEPWIPETETVNPPTVAVVIGLHGVGETAPGEEQRIDLSAGITWFGDILNRGAARRDRVPFGLWKFRGRCQALASGGGSTHDLTPLVWRTAGR